MNYVKIDNCNMNNGQGLRVVIWLSYCPFKCKNCFNAEAQDKNYGDKFTEKQYNYLIECLNNDWCSGITLSGGDAMWQTPEDIEQLIKLCEYAHQIDKTVWLWTGFTYEEIFSETGNPTQEQFARIRLFDHCDVVVDGRYIDEQRDLTLKWRGSKNQRVLDVKQCLLQNKPVLLENEN